MNVFLFFMLILRIDSAFGYKGLFPEAEILVDLREFLDPFNFSHHIQESWTYSTNCSEWYGVVCDNNNQVLNISLPNVVLAGEIPKKISDLTNLVHLDLSNNFISGIIPESIGELKNLVFLDLGSNYLHGIIPESIEKLSKLEVLGLDKNEINGTIPDGLGSLNLTYLLLSSNRLTGTIPESIFNQTNLQGLLLEENYFSGYLSENIGYLGHLVILSIGRNQLSGTIPEILFKMEKLKIIDVSRNYFNGTISIGDETKYLKLKYFENCLESSTLDQRNSTNCDTFCNVSQPDGPCGGHGICSTPSDEEKFSCTCKEGYTTHFDVFYCVDASLPSPPSPPPLRDNHSGQTLAIIISVVVSVIVVTISIMVALFWYLNKKTTELDRASTFDKRIRSHFVQCLSLQVIKGATENFSESRIIGSGGFGTVYRADGPEGEKWAVKRAKDTTQSASAEFQKEVSFISTMFHVSILSLKGYCDEEGEGILVYDFMPNGSLWNKLHKRGSHVVPLTFEERVHIAVGTAEGLHYLHNQAKPTIIHRDVKSDNILLDENLNAHVADFGLLRGRKMSLESMKVVGTPGYLDPEYLRTTMATTKSDVFSFGIVLLELITGLPPLWSVTVGGEGKIEKLLLNHVNEVFDWDAEMMADPKLQKQFSLDAMVALVALAEKCVSRLGINRPSMQEVTATLVNIELSMVKSSGAEGCRGPQYAADSFHPSDVSTEVRGGQLVEAESFAVPIETSSNWFKLR